MTTEEKAKAYDEALERARRIKNGEGNWRYSDLAEITPALTEIFPDIAESEEERIRKALILHLQAFYSNEVVAPGISKEMAIAYLEKQKEQKPIPKFKVGDRIVSTKNSILTYEILEVGHVNELGNIEYKVEIFTDGKSDNPSNIKYMECCKVDEWGKLIEQKPNYCHYGGDPNIERCKHCSAACSARLTEEQKPAEKPSKEEYVKKFKALCDAYEIKLPNREYDIYRLCEDLHKLFGDIQKPAWSEEDEKMRNQLIYDVEHHKKEGLISAKQNKATKALYNGIEKCYDEKIAWLKSLPLSLKKKNEDVAKLCSNDWTKDDEDTLIRLLLAIEPSNSYLKFRDWLLPKLKSLRPQHRDYAITFWTYLDEHRPEGKMCLSNGECADIEKAFIEHDWGKIIRYANKYQTQWKPSEEDIDKMVNERAIKSGTTKSEMAFYRNGIKDAIRRFNLRPPFKPSEEQMSALLWCIAHLGGADRRVLAELYEHLKMYCK